MKENLLNIFSLMLILEYQNLGIKLLIVFKDQMILKYLNGDPSQNNKEEFLILNLMIYLIGINIFMIT